MESETIFNELVTVAKVVINATISRTYNNIDRFNNAQINMKLMPYTAV